MYETVDEVRTERQQLRNMISGLKTQLKRPSTLRRRGQLEARLARLQLRLEEMPSRLRLADIDSRWERTVETVARSLYGNPGDYRTLTASRNSQARKRARRGLRRLETVSAEMLRLAEDHVLRLAVASPALAGMRAELDEAFAIRARLEREAFAA